MANSVQVLFPDRSGADLRAVNLREARQSPLRYKFGIQNLDNVMGPVRGGEAVILGAREGQAKTALAERFALENSLDHKVLFMSLDMPDFEVQDRLYCKLMRTNLDGMLRERKENTLDYEVATDALDARDLLLYSPKHPKQRTSREITRFAEDCGAQILIIDYSRMLTDWEPGKAAQGVVDYLIDWAHDTFTTLLLLAQLKDDAVNRRPHNGNFQDTTQLAQRADKCLLLYRPFVQKAEHDSVCEVLVTKNRKGPRFLTHTYWTGPTMDFDAMDSYQEEQAACCKRRRKKES